jgi:hypothetical protein
VVGWEGKSVNLKKTWAEMELGWSLEVEEIESCLELRLGDSNTMLTVLGTA